MTRPTDIAPKLLVQVGIEHALLNPCRTMELCLESRNTNLKSSACFTRFDRAHGELSPTRSRSPLVTSGPDWLPHGLIAPAIALPQT